ncbi:M48 family metalloprotease [Nocardia sp. NPDC020380]|uniref:M48 family metalloprotease n=1 Tax=Nocardia sp. NPDC020380 TaxID=3364309 RepID=UPI003794B8F9
MPPSQLHALMAHELGHHLIVGMRGAMTTTILLVLPVVLLELPMIATNWVAVRLKRRAPGSRAGKAAPALVMCVSDLALFAVLAWLFGTMPAALVLAVMQLAPLLRAIHQRHGEFAADRLAVDLGFGLGLRDLLRDRFPDWQPDTDPYTAMFMTHPTNRRRIRRIETRLRVLERRCRP